MLKRNGLEDCRKTHNNGLDSHHPRLSCRDHLFHNGHFYGDNSPWVYIFQDPGRTQTKQNVARGCFTYGFLTRFSHYLKHATMGILANFWLSAFEAAYTRYSWLRSVSIIRQSRIKSTINGLALANPFLFLSQFTLNILYYVYLENHEAFAVVFILYRIFALLSVSGPGRIRKEVS
ncbi:hypothetical protein BC830DRAFT_811188 [Chytriomyces sp. MP71]|nr:hypothetical protein BC830DRAFT_811188 [Chytriomyces sp. MP71]